MAAKKAAPPAKAAPKAPASTVPATVKKQELGPVMDYGELAGSGYEGTTQEDFAIPFLNLLQSNSPEVGAEGPDFAIEGARPGMLINSVTKELFDPAEGVVFVPVFTQHIFTEWRPRDQGGGLVGRHEIDSELVSEVKQRCEFGDYKTSEGNELTETFNMFGYLLPDADASEPGDIIVVSFTSTKIKVYKRIMQKLRTYKGRPPLFANRLVIKSVPDKNNHGSFFNFAVDCVNGSVAESLIPPDLDGNPHPLLVFGHALKESIQSGERRPADDSVSNEGATAGAGGKTPF